MARLLKFSVTYCEKKKKKTWKAEVLFDLTCARDWLITGAACRPVDQDCARVVLKLAAARRLMKKKQQTADGYSEKTKQNTVREYVCCERATTRDPIHVKGTPCFPSRTVTRLRPTVGPVFPVASGVQHGGALSRRPPAANLKQLPCRMRQNSSMGGRYKDGTEVAERSA